MILSLRKYIVNIEKKITLIIESIIGEEEYFNIEHRLFNSICIIVSISYIFRIGINLLLGIELIELMFSHIIVFLTILLIYYLSRFIKKPEISKFLFFSVIIMSFSFNWYYSGGTAGAMLFYYFGLFTVISVVSHKKYKILIACIILVNATLLIFLEYKHPHLIIHKVEDQKLYIYKYIHFLFVSLITMLIIQISRILYGKDQLLNKEHELFRDNGPIKNNGSDIFQFLTAQEKVVLELIRNGKHNKEIAELLFVEVSTIKTHINNIYKKAGVRTRSAILNIANNLNPN